MNFKTKLSQLKVQTIATIPVETISMQEGAI